MKTASIVLVATACNLDNVVVGLACGARGIRVPLASNLLIALITAAGTLLPMLSGRLLSTVVTPARAHAAGSAAVMLFGAWMIVREAACSMDADRPRALAEMLPAAGTGVMGFVLRVLDERAVGLMAATGVLGWRESVLIGTALTLNNAAVGLGAGMAGSSPVLLGTALVVCSMAALTLGMHAGRRFPSAWLREAAAPLAGMLLVVIGVRELTR